jgi:hypothetical protein
MAATFELVKLLSRKRFVEDSLFQDYLRSSNERVKRRILEEESYEIEVATAIATSVPALLKAGRRERAPDEVRDGHWWTTGYQTWNDQAFKKRFRLTRGTFDYILSEIRDSICKTPTPMKPNPTPPETQLGICLYRLAHGCSFLTVGDLFGVAESTAHVIFKDVCLAIVGNLYDRLVYLPKNDAEWKDELQKFLENWEFPCVGAWDGFHIFVTTKLKNFYSYKKRYTVTNMALIGHNKRFMFAAVGAPGSTHDSRLLKSCDIFSEIENGHILPHGSLNLSPFGEIPFVTVGDSAFPNRCWLLKPYANETRVHKESYFNKRLCSARVVSEHAFGMLKGRWRYLYKRTECHLDNISLVIMACITLHNFCIAQNDPCDPRWRLEVGDINMIRGNNIVHKQNNSDSIKDTILNWLWRIRDTRNATL